MRRPVELLGCLVVIASTVACGDSERVTAPRPQTSAASVEPNVQGASCASLVGQVVRGESEITRCSRGAFSGGSAPCYPRTGVQEGSFFWFVNPGDRREIIFGRGGGRWRTAPSTTTTSQLAAALDC